MMEFGRMMTKILLPYQDPTTDQYGDSTCDSMRDVAALNGLERGIIRRIQCEFAQH
jgi:hypothetical protein